jgi:protein-tyrosine phosphatase
MHHNRSTSKRSSSPHVVPESSSTLPQADGSCLGKPAAPEAVEDFKAEEAKSPKLPEFLKLTDSGK